ncbi:hypothetical protein AX15_005290 [Amanita polypyramis BW_CC]|nr:hypothetical protein AX15_005290 [Amanita polypyramis BW_CC]
MNCGHQTSSASTDSTRVGSTLTQIGLCMMDNTESSPITQPVNSEMSNVDVPSKPSKNALKKAAKAERYAAYKLERRAREKEAKKQKKRVRAEKRAAGEPDDEEESHQKKKIKLEFGGRVVIDLGFDDMMTDKVLSRQGFCGAEQYTFLQEITSLCSQLAYTYSANRSASYPFSLLYTSLGSRTFVRLEGMSNAGYKRWTETEWWKEGYEQLWSRQDVPEQEQPTADRPSSDIDTMDNPEVPSSHRKLAKAARDTVVYLTADSEEELSELKPDETYIIGGLCDHNRYKNLCFDKAKESEVRTARLPIGRYLASLHTRKVLTVNQVFEIMVKWVETRSWEEALYSIVPKRKFDAGRKNKDVSDSTVTDVRQEGVEEASGEEG